jgi:hypothetical protein
VNTAGALGREWECFGLSAAIRERQKAVEDYSNGLTIIGSAGNPD